MGYHSGMDVLKGALLRWPAFLFVLGIALVPAFFISMHGQVKTYSSLSILQDGNGVCYSRIVQTFTAKMLGKVESEHLSSPFIQMSEECYGDVVDNFHAALEESFPLIGQKVGRMTTEVYWLHEKLETRVINLSGRERGPPTSLENQFAKVESLNDEINRALEDRKVLVLKRFSLYAMALLISSLCLIIALAKYVISEYLATKFYRRLERTAGKEASKEVYSPLQVKKLLSDIFKRHGYKNCELFFNKWYAELVAISRGDFSSTANEGGPRVKEESVGYPAHDASEQLGLASVVGQILVGLGNKIYSYGVYVDIDIPEHLTIWGRAEAVFQIIYDLLTTELDNVRQVEKDAKITIQAKAAGKKVILSLNHNGAVYEKRLMGRVNRRGRVKGIPSELLIAKELLKDLGGKIVLSNGEFGSQMELVFKRAQDREVTGGTTSIPRAVSRLVRGNKREFLKNLSV